MKFLTLLFISFVSFYINDKEYWKKILVVEKFISAYVYLLILAILKFFLSVFISESASDLAEIIGVGNNFSISVILTVDFLIGY